MAPKLQDLVLHNYGVDYLSLPALRNLKCSSYDPPTETAALSRFIEHSSCRIETLYIHIYEVNDDFLHLMRLLPSLVQLGLGVVTGSLPNHVIEALHPGVRDVLLPNLKELLYLGRADFSFGTFINVLTQRWRGEIDAPSRNRLSKDSNSVSRLHCVTVNSRNETSGLDNGLQEAQDVE